MVLLGLLFSGTVFAQQSDRDNLLLQISKETNDTSKIQLMIRYAVLYGGVQDYHQRYNEIKALSLKCNYYPGLIYNRFYEGILLSDSCKFDAAILKFKSCIEGLDSLRIVQPVQYPLSIIRIIFDFAGRQEDKFKYYLGQLAYYRRHGPVQNTANCFYGIAGYYLHLADYDKAIEYYMHAQEVYKSFDPVGYSSVIGEIGNAYLRWGNLDKAEEYLKAGLKETTKMDNGDYIIYCYNNLVDLYLIKHDYKNALQCCLSYRKQCPGLAPEYRAIDLVKMAAIHLSGNALDSADFYLRAAEKVRQQEPVTMVAPYGNLELDFYHYKFYSATNDPGKALTSLKKALQQAQLLKYFPLLLKYTNELYLFLLKQGDSLQSLRYLIQYNAIQDSLNSENTRARTASYEVEKQQQQNDHEIAQLQVQKSTQRNYYLVAGAFLFLIIMGVVSRLRYRRKRDKEQLTTEFKQQLAQAETKALRAQMNPHFIFNCLNSINSFVIDKKHEIASDYLIKFSKLIRLILDNSRSETISMEKELETLKLYVLLESARFDNKFRFVYQIAEEINTRSVMIPPMLLQPFVENAIWHGLMQKESAGTLTLDIKKENEEFLNVSISDDGIGREKAAELKSKTATHKSHGLSVTSQRIEMMNRLNSTGARVNIFDLKDDLGHAAGTKVELIIPF